MRKKSEQMKQRQSKRDRMENYPFEQSVASFFSDNRNGFIRKKAENISETNINHFGTTTIKI